MEHDPTIRSSACGCHQCVAVRAIPAQRVNRYIRRHLAQPADIRPDRGPELGAEFDTHGAGSLYRPGWFVGDRQITNPEKDRLR